MFMEIECLLNPITKFRPKVLHKPGVDKKSVPEGFIPVNVVALNIHTVESQLYDLKVLYIITQT